MLMDTITGFAPTGVSFDEIIRINVAYAAIKRATVSFTVNSPRDATTTVHVRADSDPVLILRDMKRQWNGSLGHEIIGPYPTPSLSAAEIAADDAAARTLEAAHKERSERIRAECEARKRAAEARIAALPAMVRDEAAWQRVSSDIIATWRSHVDPDLGRGIVTFAERFARLAEEKLASGASTDSILTDRDLLDQANMGLDTAGLFEADARTLLAASWPHAEIIRRFEEQNRRLIDFDAGR
jgi:hypothetical protein